MFRTTKCSSSGGYFCTCGIYYFTMHLWGVQPLTLSLWNHIMFAMPQVCVLLLILTHVYHDVKFTECKVYTKHTNVVWTYSVGFRTFKARGACQFPFWYNLLEPVG